MRRPAVFFDRDNTLIIGSDYLGDPSQVVLVAGAAAAVAKCREMGFAVVVVSNQSGVARGMFSEDDVRAVDKKMADLLLASHRGAVIDRHEFCPFHPDATVPAYKQDSFLRKPKPGMILAAADAMALDLGASWMVGDAPRDITAGQAAGCRTILIMDSTLPPSPAASESMATRADFVVGSLIEAIEVITQQANKTVRPPIPEKPIAKPAPVAIAPPPVKPAPQAAKPAAPSAASMQSIAAAFATVKPPAPKPAATATPPIPKPQTVAPKTAPTPAASATATALPPQKPPAPKIAAPEPLRQDFNRLEVTCQQLLMEVKKLSDHHHDDFSISKLVAGIAQILALGAVPLAYVLYHNDAPTFQLWLLTAIFLQTLTIALLIMGKQR